MRSRRRFGAVVTKSFHMSSFEKAPISGAFVSQVPPSYGEKMNSPQMKSESKADKMFKSNSWRDLWAAILYYVHLGGVAVILGLNFMNLKKFELLKGENDSGQLFQSIGIIGISLLVEFHKVQVEVEVTVLLKNSRFKILMRI